MIRMRQAPHRQADGRQLVMTRKRYSPVCNRLRAEASRHATRLPPHTYGSTNNSVAPFFSRRQRADFAPLPAPPNGKFGCRPRDHTTVIVALAPLRSEATGSLDPGGRRGPGGVAHILQGLARAPGSARTLLASSSPVAAHGGSLLHAAAGCLANGTQLCFDRTGATLGLSGVALFCKGCLRLMRRDAPAACRADAPRVSV